MRLLLPILTLVVTCFLTFNVPSWDTIKTGCSEFAEGFKEGFSTKNSASILIQGMLALFIFSSFKNYLMLFP
ncbi:hypothetical protein [Bacillus thuringiensis]|uniref:hypothetical protein n=1 Tax=Bacillus thuringiensis TaxID=1428 RepID=UPI001145C3CB|nr:hypothetical protein [Bacillus thuringiensis]